MHLHQVLLKELSCRTVPQDKAIFFFQLKKNHDKGYSCRLFLGCAQRRKKIIR